jgi:hypothetical protein
MRNRRDSPGLSGATSRAATIAGLVTAPRSDGAPWLDVRPHRRQHFGAALHQAQKAQQNTVIVAGPLRGQPPLIGPIRGRSPPP